MDEPELQLRDSGTSAAPLGTTSERYAFGRTRTGRLIVFTLSRPGLVPRHAVDLAAGPPVEAPGLDLRRAGLWLLAGWLTVDEESEPEPASDALDHHLLLIAGEPGPLLADALDTGTVERTSTGAYVTRTPVPPSVARRWADESPRSCIVHGANQTDRALNARYVHEHEDDALRFIQVTSQECEVDALPPEWIAALADAELAMGDPPPRITLSEVCSEVRALDLDGGSPEGAAQLEAEFREGVRTPRDAPDAWPEQVVAGSLLPRDELPEHGPGHTVVLTRFDRGLVVLMLVLAVWLGSTGYFVFVGHASSMARASYVVVFALAAAALTAWLHKAWRLRLERDRAVLWSGLLPREVTLEQAERRLRGTLWRALAATREQARQAGWRRAQLAVVEWILHTQAGRRHREDRELDKGPPLEAFAVTAHDVRFLGDGLWTRVVDSQTARNTIYNWQLKPKALRAAAPDAELVLVSRTEPSVSPIYLASATDGPSAIRASIIEAGGHAAEG